MYAALNLARKSVPRTQAGYFLPLELLLMLVWVLCPPLAVAALVLRAVHARMGSPGTWRMVQAGVLLVLLSFVLAGALVVCGPSAWSHWLGLRDEPVTWAPFAFLAVALALPPSVWWIRRAGRSRRNGNAI